MDEPLIPGTTEPLTPDKGEREELAMLEAVGIQVGQLTEAMKAIILWKQRVFKVAVACGIIAVLCLGAFGYAVWKVHANQLSNCANGNSLRVTNRQLWAYIVKVSDQSPHPGETPAQKQLRQAQSRAFLAYVNGKFATVDCATRYPWF